LISGGSGGGKAPVLLFLCKELKGGMGGEEGERRMVSERQKHDESMEKK